MPNQPFLTEDEQRRFRMILGEIQDSLNAMQTEVLQHKSYKGYLQEKLNTLITDVPVLQGMLKD